MYKGFFEDWCRNVGENHKTFFREREHVPETENIGLLWDKVPMFCPKSTDVCLKEVRCFHFPKRRSSPVKHDKMAMRGT